MHQQIDWTSWRKGIILSAAFLLALSVAIGCKKKTNTLGLGALDPNTLLASGGIDTFQLRTYSVHQDSFPTDNQARALLGAYNDPKMGTVNASFYTQLHLAGSLGFAQGAAPIVDSVVLSLHYGGYYGNLTAQTFQVYQMSDLMNVDSTYYKFTTMGVQGSDLVDPAYATMTPDPTDSIMVGTDKLPAQLRIRLDNNFGQTMINDAVANSAMFEADDQFVNYFKGLRVSVADANPASGTGAVLYFNLSNSNSKLTIYYRLPPDTATFALEFEIDATCADFNHVDIDNTGYPVADVLADTISGMSQYYAQANQSQAVIEFKSFDNIPKSSVIHNALLVVPIAHQTNSMFYPSLQLAVGYRTDTGQIVAFEKTDAYDDATKSYIIDIRNYLQDVLLGNADNRGIYLYPLNFGSTTERLIFNGPHTQNKFKPKLIVKYTKY